VSEQVQDAFAFYSEYLKPLYCEIEARDNTIPVEMLFEIHAAFDHLRRFYVNGDEETTSTRRAIGHLKRASLDAFKLKLKYFNADLERLLGLGACLELVDNGSFIEEILRDKQKIIKIAKQARIDESKNDPETAFDTWIQTSILIDETTEKILNSQVHIDSATIKAKNWFNKDKFQGLWIGFLSGFLSSLAVWLLTR